MIKRIMTIGVVLSLTACASVQSGLQQGSDAVKNGFQKLSQPTAQQQSTVTAQQPDQILDGKVLAVRNKATDGSDCTLIVQLNDGTTFPLQIGKDVGYKVNQNVKLYRFGKRISVQGY